MKKHISLSYAVLIIAAASLGSCAVDVEEVSKGGIAGIVADKVTGEPVPTVKLKLSPGGNSTVTGSDGSFQFEELEAGEYTVEADLESVMVTPKAFKVTNDNLMTTQNITLREGSNLGYIGNYIGSFIAQ